MQPAMAAQTELCSSAHLPRWVPALPWGHWEAICSGKPISMATAWPLLHTEALRGPSSSQVRAGGLPVLACTLLAGQSHPEPQLAQASIGSDGGNTGQKLAWGTLGPTRPTLGCWSPENWKQAEHLAYNSQRHCHWNVPDEGPTKSLSCMYFVTPLFDDKLNKETVSWMW